MPTNQTCWFVPGFMGTELWVRQLNPDGTPTARRQRVWLSISALIHAQGYRFLKLPTPAGYQIEVGEVLNEGYGTCLGYLSRPGVRPEDSVLRPWAYDWRQPIKQLGAQLAAEIRAVGGAPGSHQIVGHSMGAGVAMAAYRHLKEAGAERLVSRIVTLGGVLWGSYSPCYAWSEREDGMNLLALVPTLARNPFLLPFSFHRPQPQGFPVYVELCELFTSWPSVYDMLPDPERGDDPDDMFRWLVWSTETWTAALAPPYPWQLARARTEYHAWIHDPAGFPPADVLFHVVGMNQQTPLRARWPEGVSYRPTDLRVSGPYFHNIRQALMPTMSTTREGDNRVTVKQQTIPGRASLQINGEHAALQDHPEFLSRFWSLVRQPITGDLGVVYIDAPTDFPTRVAPPRRVDVYQHDPSLHRPYSASTGQIVAQRAAAFVPKSPVVQVRRTPRLIYNRRGVVIRGF